MKNKFTTILFLLGIITSINAQNGNFAWFKNIKYDIDSTNYEFKENLKLINNDSDINFLILTGNISANGYLYEFEEVKTLLDNTSLKYNVLPGINDIDNSQFLGIDYKETFGNNHFIVKDKSVLHIGIRSQKYPLGNSAHITPSELNWLSDQLKRSKQSEKIFIYLNYPLSKIDNSLKLKNILSGRDIRIFSTDENTGFDIVSFNDDSLTVNDKFIDNTFYFIPQDSLDFIDYTQSQSFEKSKLNFSIIWQKDLNTYTPNNVLIDNNNYFIVNQKGNIYCLDEFGEISWTHQLRSEVISKPVAINGILVVATIDGELLSINSKTGQTIQSIGIDDVLSTEILKTKVDYYGIETDAVIVGSKSGTFYCYTLNKLELVWSNNPSNSDIITKPLSVNNRIIYGSKDGYLYSIDGRTGVLYWKWEPKKTRELITDFSNPVSDGENVFISISNGDIYKIDLLLGTTLLRISRSNAILSLGLSSTGRTIITFDNKEKLLLNYSKTGGNYKELKIDLGEEITKHKPIEFNRHFLIASDKGTLYLVNKSYNIFPVLFIGTSALHSVQQINENEFLISNFDGKIIYITLQ